jgi:hypothetical protein
MAEITKTQHKLPPEVVDTFQTLDLDSRNAYIYALRSRGWTLQSIAEASGVTRERVRQIALRKPNTEIPFYVPTPPEKPVSQPREFVEPTERTLNRLLELQPLAQQVRGKGMRFRAEAEEYTNLLHYAHTVEGVTLYRLAKRLGVTHGALRFRLARYGLKTHEGTSRVYTPIMEKNRAR